MNTRKLHRFVTATLTAALLGASMLNGAAARQTPAASIPEAGANTALAAPGLMPGVVEVGELAPVEEVVNHDQVVATLRVQAPHEVGADEAGAAGDECAHGAEDGRP